MEFIHKILNNENFSGHKFGYDAILFPGPMNSLDGALKHFLLLTLCSESGVYKFGVRIC